MTDEETQQVVAEVGEKLGEEWDTDQPKDALDSFFGSGEADEEVSHEPADDEKDGESTDDMPESAEADDEDTEVEASGRGGQAGPNPAMVNLAQSLGVSDETIRALGTDDALRVYLQDRLKVGGKETGDNAPVGPEPLDDYVPFEFDVQLDPEDVTEPIAKWADTVQRYKAHNDKYLASVGKEVRQMQGTLQAMANHLANERAQQDQQWFEGQVEALVNKQPEWKDVFGSTRYAEVVNTKKHKEAWDEAYAELMAQAERNPRRKSPLAPDQLFTRAVRAVHGDKVEKLARKALADKDKAMADDHGSLPPTARKSVATRHPEEQAVADVAKFLKENRRGGS